MSYVTEKNEVNEVRNNDDNGGDLPDRGQPQQRPQLQVPPTVYHYEYSPTIEDFVYQYYGTLEHAPHEAWRHYAMNAQYMHVDGDAATDGFHMEPAVGHYQINSNVMHQQFIECKFYVRTVNVQRAPAAYLVLVTGDVTRGRGPAAAFIQSFLVEFAYEFNQFVISNSILKVFTAVA